MTALKGHWQLLVLVSLVFLLWQTPVMLPLKLFVVFLHELSHALMTILTGGRVISLSISPLQGGEVWSAGGIRFLTLTAGYLGSLLIGVVLLLLALRTRVDKFVIALCGIALLVVAALYVRDIFALAFCVGTGLAMLAIARYLGHEINDLLLRLIGLTSMIYVPYDIFSDTIARSALRSDARMLAEEFGGTTMIWGGIWLLISVFVIFQSLRKGLGPSSNISWPSKDR
ncbi:Peptidase M50B-like [Cognatiyoonia koreensis]|uniref:Peptidase M50B-like n=1 Tax=Cognatiyoonia koreensis TaxID=364200 RepID=A0A1I0REV0_9RHOB|nr:M50 family metallopeptidase [Cognatiyoonia koreensis]SEW38756.1 Peptidase M50B-like [Cognatiyoonia koreensis]